MSQKQVKKERNPKHSVKEVLKSIHWSVESGKLVLLSTITDEFVTIELDAIKNTVNGKAQ